MDLQSKIIELREQFLKKYEEEPPTDESSFHPDDLARIETKDEWLKRFLEHVEFNVEEALTMLWSTCEWRKKVGANEISENNVKLEWLEEGAFFGYGEDRDGKKLFVIRAKLHSKTGKNQKDLERCVIYWFERLEREGNGNQITFLYDMNDAGFSNMDMEFTKYLINLCKYYYPNFLNYILLLDLPWILNTVYKLVKSWLPPKSISKIRQVNKTTLLEYVDPSIAWKSWGGTNNYQFHFVPEVRSNGILPLNGKCENKKVHFAEGSPLNEQASSSFGDQSTTDSMLTVTPDVIALHKDGHEIIGTIVLKNQTADKCLSYKIKTTAPEKFRVRPSTGALSPLQNVTVSVSIQPGFHLRNSLQNEKFLVMCLPMDKAKMTPNELTDFWKMNEMTAEQHRVWCRDGVNEPTSILSSSASINNDRTTDTLCAKITHLEECHSKLHKELRTLKYVMMLSVIWTVIAAIVIVYIVRSDLEQVLGSDQSCQIRRG